MTDTTAHILTAVIAGLALVATIWQFIVGRAQASKEPFLKEQMQLCFRACAAVGAMLSERDSAKWEAARAEFWVLYWGPLCVVEDAAVDSAMEALGERLPAASAPTPSSLPLDDPELQLRSLKLAYAMRALILRCWRSDQLLGQLEPLPESASVLGGK